MLRTPHLPLDDLRGNGTIKTTVCCAAAAHSRQQVPRGHPGRQCESQNKQKRQPAREQAWRHGGGL
ncbi:MAG: hypothetical protein Q8L55_02215 [Phycisphaerales bacterium]|nr:hypothetical protein [Phycisphaerales bacterium]